MSYRFTCGLTALLLVTLLATPTLAVDAVVKIDRAQGMVEVRHKEATRDKWEDAEEQQELTPGWELRTRKESKALLVFPQGNTVTLRAESFVRILEVDDSGAALIESDKPGGLLVTVKNKLAGGKEFTLRTPSAHAIVRGTEYGAQIISTGTDSDGKPTYETEFYGYEGEVTIENEFGSQLLEADQTIRAIAGLIPGVAVPSLPGVAGEFFNIITAENPEEYVKKRVKDEAEDFIRDKVPGGFGGIGGLF